MKPAPIPAQYKIDAFLAPILAVIAGLFQLLLGAPRAEISRAVAAAERAVQQYIFLQAAARAPSPIVTRRPQHQRLNAPRGFRRGTSRRMLFACIRIANRRAGFAQRIGHLIAVLLNPERHIARFIKLIFNRRPAGVLIAIAPPAQAFASAPVQAPQPTDSS